MDKKLIRYMNGCILIATGIFLFFIAYYQDPAISLVLGILLGCYGLVRIVIFFKSRSNGFHETMASLVGGVLTMALGIFLMASPEITTQLLEKSLSGWLILTGLVYLLITYTYKTGQEPGWIMMLILSLLAIILGFFLWYDTFWARAMVGIVLPAYLLFVGFYQLINWSLIKGQKGVQIALPLLLQAFLPQKTLAKSESTWTKEQIAASHLAVTTPAQIDDVEVLIHMSKRAAHSFGHVDVMFGNCVFSYGNYDHSKQAMHLPGLLFDGVFVTCPRQNYLELSLTREQKTIFGYQLGLNKAQKELLCDNVKHFLQHCIPWSPEEKDRKSNGYSWALHEAGANLYKVKESRFRYYFVLNSNCALLSEVLLKGVGIPHARSLGGVVTPGSMLSLYEKELEKQDSIVIAKKEYLPQ